MEHINIKGTMKVSTWLSMHLCLAQRLVELVRADGSTFCGYAVEVRKLG